MSDFRQDRWETVKSDTLTSGQEELYIRNFLKLIMQSKAEISLKEKLFLMQLNT